jgi:hypothetical protein
MLRTFRLLPLRRLPRRASESDFLKTKENMFAQLPSQPTGTSTQTWAALITTVVGAVAAVLARKRFSRSKTTTAQATSKGNDYIPRTEFHQALDSMRDRLDANHRELMAALTGQGITIEKRLDALESAVARLDERTKMTA